MVQWISFTMKPCKIAAGPTPSPCIIQIEPMKLANSPRKLLNTRITMLKVLPIPPPHFKLIFLLNRRVKGKLPDHEAVLASLLRPRRKYDLRQRFGGKQDCG